MGALQLTEEERAYKEGADLHLSTAKASKSPATRVALSHEAAAMYRKLGLTTASMDAEQVCEKLDQAMALVFDKDREADAGDVLIELRELLGGLRG